MAKRPLTIAIVLYLIGLLAILSDILQVYEGRGTVSQWFRSVSNWPVIILGLVLTYLLLSIFHSVREKTKPREWMDTGSPVTQHDALLIAALTQRYLDAIVAETYREERVFIFANDHQLSVVAQPIKEFSNDIIEKSNRVATELQLSVFSRLAHALHALNDAIRQWNEKPSLDLRDIRRHAMQLIPPLLTEANHTVDNVFTKNSSD